MDYRGWINSDPNKRWALNYVGNDYDASNSGINSGKLYADTSNGAFGRVSGNEDAIARSKAKELSGYASQYASWLNSQGTDNTQIGGTGGGTSYGSSSGGGSSAPAAPAYDPQQVALIDDLIVRYQDSINRIGNQRSIGEGNINSSYQAGVTNLQNQRTQAQQGYDTQKTETGQDFANTRAQIGQEAGNQTNAMRRLLGSIGAGRSTAARELTPYAAGLQASTRFGDVQNTFARNQNKLDTSWNSTKRSLDDEEAYLGSQKQEKLNQLYSGLSQTEAELQGQIGDQVFRKKQVMGGNATQALGDAQPYRNRINQLLGEIDNYGRLSVAAPKSVQYARPDLAQYDYSKFDAPTLTGDTRASYVSPFARLLQKRDEEEKLSY
jgi:hypothetical protein